MTPARKFCNAERGLVAGAYMGRVSVQSFVGKGDENLSRIDKFIEMQKETSMMYAKLGELFTEIGVDTPEAGTTHRASIPYIQAAIDRVKELKQKLADSFYD